jgi:2'-5' RNA ligase
MHGLVSLLDPVHDDQVQAIWQQLQRECGLSGMLATPYPHFSWQIAADYDWDLLGEQLAELAGAFPPFQVRTSGLGLFTGEQPVLYIPIIRTAGLDIVHTHLWEATRSLGVEISAYYAPDAWKPHIALAQGDINPHTIACAVNQLVEQRFDWEIPIDNLAVIYAPDGQTAVMRERYRLQGEVQVAS